MPPQHRGAPRILWLDQDSRALAGAHRALRRRHPSWQVVWVTSPERAMAFLAHNDIDVLLTDVTFEGGAAGRLLDWVAGRDPGLPCLIATRRPDLAVRRYLPKNVQRVLLKPIDEDVLVGCLERAVRARGVAPGIVQARPPSEAPPRRASAVACSTRLGGALRAAGAK